MTVSTTDNKQQFVGDGVTLIFEVTYKVFREEDIAVYFESELQESGFTVVLNPDQESAPGAAITFDDPPDDEVSITIVRVVPLTQETDYQPFDAFPAETHERALDNLTMQTQQLQEEVDRAYKAPIDSEPGEDFSFPPYDPGKLIGWSETEENVLENAEHSFEDIEEQANIAVAAATSSQVSAGASAGQAALSEEWASNPEDEPVTGGGGLFSARHYAIKALRARGGLNLVAIISGDDLCPKPGDDPPSVCQVPDHRNPGERFPDRENFPGDYFIISQAGSMDLKDPTDPEAPNSTQFVEPSDYIIFLPEIEDGDGAIIVGEGWYRQAGLAGEGGSADTITFDDSGTIIKGTNVQAWNVAADGQIELNRVEITLHDLRITLAQSTADAAQVTADQGVSDAAAAQGTANSAQGDATQALADAGAANVNANSRKPEFDFIRTGSRLDINNVRTS